MEENILNFVELEHCTEFVEYEQTKRKNDCVRDEQGKTRDLLVYRHDRENFRPMLNQYNACQSYRFVIEYSVWTNEERREVRHRFDNLE